MHPNQCLHRRRAEQASHTRLWKSANKWVLKMCTIQLITMTVSIFRLQARAQLFVSHRQRLLKMLNRQGRTERIQVETRVRRHFVAHGRFLRRDSPLRARHDLRQLSKVSITTNPGAGTQQRFRLTGEPEFTTHFDYVNRNFKIVIRLKKFSTLTRHGFWKYF